MDGHSIKNAADPSSHQHVATKNYVDSNAITTFANLRDSFPRKGGSNSGWSY